MVPLVGLLSFSHSALYGGPSRTTGKREILSGGKKSYCLYSMTTAMLKITSGISGWQEQN